jgi:hypothetical protein
MVPSLQNSAIDALARACNSNKRIPTEEVRSIWEKTLPSSPLRRFVLDHAVYKMKYVNWLRKEANWPREALLELVQGLFDREVTKGFNLPEQERCHYHIHKNGEKC